MIITLSYIRKFIMNIVFIREAFNLKSFFFIYDLNVIDKINTIFVLINIGTFPYNVFTLT